MKPRVHLLTNVPAPYRLPVFAELGREVQLTVCFGRAAAADRRWQTSPLPDYVNSEFLPHRALPLPGIELTWNSGYGRFLTAHPAAVYIAGENVTDLPAVVATLRAARRRRAPFILWSEAIDTPYASGNRLSNAYRRWLYPQISVFLAYGRRAQEFLETRGAPTNRILQGWQVVPPEQLPPPTRTRAQLGLDDTPIILAVGYLTTRKGFDLLIRAVQQLEGRAQLVIVGDGPERAALQQLAASNGRIHFTGHQDGSARSDWYAAADLFVLPTHHDPWGLVVNEAMAFGLPIIVSEAAGCAPDLVQDNGRILPTNDVTTLTAALADLLARPEERRRMGQRSQEIIAPYTVTRAAAAFVAAIELAQRVADA
ncbi:MAG: glycosyltransferase family 4 protein [Chloroflexi bacterium]|nr:glycosyltransferase family 4 protein [Chloroflexota bacterium]MBP7042872.1 glycosyltransferase family 4 protein [Chloroflexota bacterium]